MYMIKGERRRTLFESISQANRDAAATFLTLC